MRRIVLMLAASGALAVAGLALGGAGAESADPGAELLMIEQPGCEWCARWDEEIGGAYPKTEEGRRAPLRRIDLRSTELKAMALKPRPRFTPTFILLSNGEEVGRIEGYPGDHFFWGLFQRLLDKLPEESPAAVSK